MLFLELTSEVQGPPIMLLAALRIIGAHYGIHASR